MIKSWYLNGQSVIGVQRSWSTAFKNTPKPTHSAIKPLVEKFERTGSVRDDIEAMKTKKRTVRTPEIIEATRAKVSESPTLSLTKLAQQLGYSVASAWRILRKDLKHYPYKIQMLQRLSEASVKKRLEFAIEITNLWKEKGIDFNKIIFTDECHFWLDGYVNRHNYRIWGSEPPQVFRTTPLHPQKLTVWCGIWSGGLIGPYVIDTTVGAETYQEMLVERLFPDLELLVLDKDDIWFQQDGAPAHSARTTLEMLRTVFGNRVISRNFPETFGEGLAWPPYSPDLAPNDFFLWGCVKDKVYKEMPTSLEDLARKVDSVIGSITAEMCHSAIRSFQDRLQKIMISQGQHIENIVH